MSSNTLRLVIADFREWEMEIKLKINEKFLKCFLMM